MPDLDSYDDYYEQPRLWGRILSPGEEERIQQVLRLVPGDCDSILEVGCGDGRIINRLASQNGRTCGLDSSLEALKHVKTERTLGSADSLPFPSQSFDAILCCEVLEHLPFRAYPKSLEEVQRVAAKYIIVSVPYREALKRNVATCPQCGCVFRPDRHLRYFNDKTMANLFKDFGLQATVLCQSTIRVYPPLIMELARYLSLRSLPPRALCPQCGYTSTNAAIPHGNINSRARLHGILRPLVRRLTYTKKYPRWILALYRRK